jgi:hypothetical protein
MYFWLNIYERPLFSMTREKGINVIIYDEMVCAGYFQGGKVRT